jgi:TPR repeat protein
MLLRSTSKQSISLYEKAYTKKMLIMKKINLYLIILAVSFASIAGNNAKAAQIEPCMTQICIDYFNKWKKLSYRKYNTALSTMGEFYYEGYGTEKNLDKSFKYFKKAAKYKYPYAEYRTALFYLAEEGYFDTDRGIKYLKRAARNGHKESAFLLALIYGSEELIEKDTEESDKWLNKAIEGNHSKSQRYANFLHNNGDITHNSYPKVATTISLLNKASAESTLTEQMNVIADDNVIQWPENNNHEVILVSAPKVEEVFDYALGYLQINPPASRGTTGTRIVGRTCADNFSCGRMNEFEFQKMGGSIINPHAKKYSAFVKN